MSWDVDLVGENGVVTVDPHTEGGTYAVGGSSRASLNITYNYSYFYYNELDSLRGLRWLDGKKAKNTTRRLENAVEALGTDPHQDCQSYWCPSIGRAGKELATLLEWAREHPDAEWRVI